MADDKRAGVTRAIRAKLNFEDERLWKRFLARRLELIDTLALSTKKASEQEDEIHKVAEILRLEFKYEPDYFGDFEKLVRAAVQSVRRNRKRSGKPRSDGKRPRLSERTTSQATLPDTETSDHVGFLLEISQLHTDGLDHVYDMNYPRQKLVDRSRAAIDELVGETQTLLLLLGVILLATSLFLGSASLVLDARVLGPQDLSNAEELRALRLSLLLLMKRSRTCLELTMRTDTGYLRQLGQLAMESVRALIFDKSFSGLSSTSVEYLQEKLALDAFLAAFYRAIDSLNPTLASLDDASAAATLQTLVGGCIRDFGYDRVLFLIGEAFYRSVVAEYPFVQKLSRPFLRSTAIHAPGLRSAEPEDFKDPGVLRNTDLHIKPEINHRNPASPPTQDTTPLTSLAAVATELCEQQPSRKKVILTFLSSSLEFYYERTNLAPPRYGELIENARHAFKLTDTQAYGLRNLLTSSLIHTDLDLEKLFAGSSQVHLEVFSQGYLAIPIHHITLAVTSSSSDDRRKYVLPLPMIPTPPPVLPALSRRNLQFPAPVLPKFQPLL